MIKPKKWKSVSRHFSPLLLLCLAVDLMSFSTATFDPTHDPSLMWLPAGRQQQLILPRLIHTCAYSASLITHKHLHTLILHCSRASIHTHTHTQHQKCLKRKDSVTKTNTMTQEHFCFHSHFDSQLLIHLTIINLPKPINPNNSHPAKHKHHIPSPSTLVQRQSSYKIHFQGKYCNSKPNCIQAVFMKPKIWFVNAVHLQQLCQESLPLFLTLT